MSRTWKSRQEARADDRFAFQVSEIQGCFHTEKWERNDAAQRFADQEVKDFLKTCFYCGWNYAPPEKLCRCVPYYAGGDGCSYGCDYCTTKHLWDDYDRMKSKEEEQDEGLRILKLMGWKAGA